MNKYTITYNEEGYTVVQLSVDGKQYTGKCKMTSGEYAEERYILNLNTIVSQLTNKVRPPVRFKLVSDGVRETANGDNRNI